MPAKKLSVFLFVILLLLFVGQTAMADKTYTSTADFKEGTPVDVNAAADQLQLDSTSTPFAFVNVAASARGTLVRIDAASGDILGEYRTAPGFKIDGGTTPYPSRTGVDSKGNVWVANSNIAGELGGSIVKIGVFKGGTRFKEETDVETGEPVLVEDPGGEYVQGPFGYNTCVDRDGDGLIRTSSGLPGNILSWPSSIEGEGTVKDATDECILVYQRLPNAPNAHHVSVDAEDNVWVGGYVGQIQIETKGAPNWFYKLDGQTGAVLDAFDAAAIGCGGFGGLVDSKGVLWSASHAQNKLLRYDPDSEIEKGRCIAVTYSWGLAADTNGFIWNSMWIFNATAKIDPDDLAAVPIFSTKGPVGTDQGVAITPIDNNVWVAKGTGANVIRLDNDGTILKIIDLDTSNLNPTGIAVDANGKVWVTNKNAAFDQVQRIDPTLGTDSLGAVDLTVDLGTGAAPDNYSDMTGVVDIVSTPAQGSWTVVHDGGAAGTEWDTIAWNAEGEGNEPEGTAIAVEARVSDSEPVNGEVEGNYVPVSNGEALLLTGRYIQMRVTLTPNDGGESPVLSDLTVTSIQPEGLICDLDGNEIIDIYDILGIFFTIDDSADQPFDPRDTDEDGTITFDDVRECIRDCTYKYCQPADYGGR